MIAVCNSALSAPEPDHLLFKLAPSGTEETTTATQYAGFNHARILLYDFSPSSMRLAHATQVARTAVSRVIVTSSTFHLQLALC